MMSVSKRFDLENAWRFGTHEEETFTEFVFNQGKKEGKAEAILRQANHDEAVKQSYEKGMEDALREVWDKALKYDEVIFLEELSEIIGQIKEQKNESR